ARGARPRVSPGGPESPPRGSRLRRVPIAVGCLLLRHVGRAPQCRRDRGSGRGAGAGAALARPRIHACRTGFRRVVRVLQPAAPLPRVSQETISMRVRQLPLCVLACTVLVTATSVANAQPGDTFTATATVQPAGGAAAPAPVTITVARTMPQAEADKLSAAFKSGGAAGLRKALKGVAPTGSITLGKGKPTPTRITIDRTTDKGRL